MGLRFLGDNSLGDAVVGLMRGDDIRCAVAFWGTGAIERLFSDGGLPPTARVVCDISMGSTNPAELRAMRAPSNMRLKHLERLHAKVYISDRGCIVCSANASDSGIGLLNLTSFVEAGVFIDPQSDAFRAVEVWFERIWRRAKVIDNPTLDRATEVWSRRPPRSVRALDIPKGAPSLLGTVEADPQRFRGIGFVFTTGAADKDDRDEAADALAGRDDKRKDRLLSQEERRKLEAWNLGNLFTGWSEQNLDAWPRRFVCIHRPSVRVSYWFYERAYEILLGEDRGVVFAERPKGLKTQLGFSHGAEAMLKTDSPLLERIFAHLEERSEHWLCENGERLMQLIGEID
jgi:hypothetical protein